MVKKLKQKKQKGAKGKKARAKAKLERQWGEVASEEHVKLSKIRKGKSRILKSNDDDNKDVGNDYEKMDSMNQNLVESNSASRNTIAIDKKEEWRGRQDSLNSLLTKIKYSTDDFIREYNTMEERSGQHTSDKITGGDETNLEDLAITKNRIDDAVTSYANAEAPAACDPITCHFDKPPFDSEEVARKNLDEVQETMQFIEIPHSDKPWEMSISGPIRGRYYVAEELVNLSTNSLSTVTPKVIISPPKLDIEVSKIFSYTTDKLSPKWTNFNRKALLDDGIGKDNVSDSILFTDLQTLLYPALANYGDILFTAETRENRMSLHNLLALHILNHTLKSRSDVLEHNKQLRQLEGAAKVKKEVLKGNGCESANKETDDDCFRDQGYIRPKVFVLLPTRGTCLTFVQRLLQLLGDASDVTNLERFESDFGVPVEEGDGEIDERTKSIISSKGPEWNELFGSNVNEDDDFKVGISLGPKQTSKKRGKSAVADGGVYFNLYSDFYQSDIILASPLGMKMVIADKDQDFLSSVEVCLVAYSDVLLMQNWDHVETVLSSINLQPKKIHESTDFSRVRNYHLVGQAAYFRQLIFTSSFSDPNIISTFKRSAKSLEGRLRIRGTFSPSDAAVCSVMVSVKQIFQRVNCFSLSKQSEVRLKYFEQKVLPQLIRLNQKRTLIYIPSYFDFVTLRNTLIQKDVSFCSVTEYCKQNDISRNRARFVQGKKNILLYTGRAHFFMRFNIKGARHLIFLGLPEHREFYVELINRINNKGNVAGENEIDIEAPPTCLALFTKYDAFALERIVGSKTCGNMINQEKGTFLFST